MGIQLMYIMIQDVKTVKKQGFFFTSTASRAILLLQYVYMYLLHQGVYTLQILHTASLVGQNLEKNTAMCVHVYLTYIMIQDQQTVKGFHKYRLFLLWHQRLYSYFDTCTCTCIFSIKGCTFFRFCTQLA